MRVPSGVTTAEGLKVATASHGRSLCGASIGLCSSRRTANISAGAGGDGREGRAVALDEGGEEGGQRCGRNAHDLVGAAIVDVEHVTTDDRPTAVDDAGLAVILIRLLWGEHRGYSAKED